MYVTYEELFQFVIMICSIVSIIVLIYTKK